MTFEEWFKEEGEFQVGQWSNSKALMEMAWQESRKQALEEAAKECDEWAQDYLDHAEEASGGQYDWLSDGAKTCASAIRAMKDS